MIYKIKNIAPDISLFDSKGKLNRTEFERILTQPSSTQERIIGELVMNSAPRNILVGDQSGMQKIASEALRELDGAETVDQLQRKLNLMRMLLAKKNPKSIDVF